MGADAAAPRTSPIRAARGSSRTAHGWPQEAALRMLQNNLDPEVAEAPADLVVYGGTGKAARDWPSYHALVRTLANLGDDETMLVAPGRPVGVLRTHEWAPRVLLANSNLVPEWATWPEFRRLERLGLTMYGQMTAGSWIYIGTQGILQGTYKTFAAVAEKGFGGSLSGHPDPHRRLRRHGRLVASGAVRTPIVIGRDHLDCGSVASPYRETEAMADGSDAIADWPLLNTASGASWVSIHYGGGVGIGRSVHAGQVWVADGSDLAAQKLERVLTNDPGTGVIRHTDAGYDLARGVAEEHGVRVPMREPDG